MQRSLNDILSRANDHVAFNRIFNYATAQVKSLHSRGVVAGTKLIPHTCTCGLKGLKRRRFAKKRIYSLL